MKGIMWRLFALCNLLFVGQTSGAYVNIDAPPVDLGSVSSFQEQLKRLKDQMVSSYSESSLELVSKVNFNVDAWNVMPRNAKLSGLYSPLPSMGSSVGVNQIRRSYAVIWTKWGCTLGEQSFALSSSFRLGNCKRRPRASDFTSIKMFKEFVANGQENDSAIGSYYDLFSLTITTIAVGLPRFQVVILEETDDSRSLIPKYLSAPERREVVQLRMTPDGARPREYYIALVKASALEKIAYWQPKKPESIDHFKGILEELIESTKPSLQKILKIIVFKVGRALPLPGTPTRVDSAEEDGNAPKIRQLPSIKDQLEEQRQSLKAATDCWFYSPRDKEPLTYQARGQSPETLGFTECSSNSFHPKSSVDRRGRYSFAVDAETIVFTGGIKKTKTTPNPLFKKEDFRPDFSTLQRFRLSVKATEASAIGVKAIEDGGALIVASVGKPPLKVVIFEESPATGKMMPIMLSRSDGIENIPIRAHGEVDRTREYWVVLVRPSSVETLINLEPARPQCCAEFQKITNRLSDELMLPIQVTAKTGNFMVARVPPRNVGVVHQGRAQLEPSSPKVLDDASSDRRDSCENGAAEETQEGLVKQIDVLTEPSPALDIRTHRVGHLRNPWFCTPAKIVFRTVESDTLVIHYVGRRLQRSPRSLALHKYLSRTGIYMASDLVVLSERFKGTKTGKRNLARFVRRNPPFSVVDGLKGIANSKRIRAFAVGYDSERGELHVHDQARSPMVLIKIQESQKGRLSFKVVSKSRTMLIFSVNKGERAVYAVVHRNILAHLPSLVRETQMPLQEDGLEMLAHKLQQFSEYPNPRPDPRLSPTPSATPNAALQPVISANEELTFSSDNGTDTDTDTDNETDNETDTDDGDKGGAHNKLPKSPCVMLMSFK